MLAVRPVTALRGHAWVLGFGLGAIGAGQTMLYSLLGPSARQIGISEFQTGWIVSLSALVLTLASPWWGRRIDRSGGRNSYLFGLASYVLGTMAFALVLAAGLNGHIDATLTLAAMLAVRALYAFMTAGTHPAAMAYIALRCTDSERLAQLAIISGCTSTGYVLGPVFAAVIAGWGQVAPLYLAAAIALSAGICGWRLLAPDTPVCIRDHGHHQHHLGPFDPRVVLPLLAIVAAHAGFSALQQTLAFRLQDIAALGTVAAIKQAGLAFSLFACSMVFAQLLVLRRSVWPPGRLFHAGGALCMLGFVMLAATTSRNVLLVAQLPLGAGFGLLFPALQSRASVAVARHEQGAVAGLVFAAAALGYVLGPLAGTALLAVSGVAPFVFAALTMVVVLFAARHGVR